jgi:16S rRNA (adenine1518-N6/adenine1519-N6)-dimethyltransferase
LLKTAGAAMSLAEEARRLLKKLNASARKKLGQNFMVDDEALKAIAAALSIKSGETVLEVGPGLGFLTRELLNQGAKVLAVEKDTAYVRHLREYFKDKPLALKEGDILETDIDRDFAVSAPIKLIGNIPYNITSPILEWMIGQRNLIQEAVLTTQWEVAQRLMAKPGGKTWGSLSVYLQMYSDVTLVKKISPSSFDPAPGVESAVLHFIVKPEPRFPIQEKEFFNIVRHSFQHRRKTILNSLSSLVDKQRLLAALTEAEIDPKRRPETLALFEWASLASLLTNPPKTSE